MSTTAAHTPETDRSAIRDLVERYAAFVDDLRLDEAANLFLPDGILVTPSAPKQLGPTVTHQGREAIAAEMAALHHFSATFHAVHGVVIDATDADADTATGRVSCTAHHLSAGDDKHRDLTWHLVYRDTYQRTDAGWRFARREQTIVTIHTSNPRAVRPTVVDRAQAR